MTVFVESIFVASISAASSGAASASRLAPVDLNTSIS
jgi:hypothetical protein